MCVQIGSKFTSKCSSKQDLEGSTTNLIASYALNAAYICSTVK